MKLLLFVSLLLGPVAFAESESSNTSQYTTAGVQVDCDADSGGVCPVGTAADNIRLGDDTRGSESSYVSPSSEGAE